MGKREHLRRLRIRTVDKDKRRIRINESKAPKLLHIEPAMCVIAGHAVDHSQDAEILDDTAKLGHRRFPRANFCRPLIPKPDGTAHFLPDGHWIAVDVGGADKIKGGGPLLPALITQPMLPPLHGMEGVQQIGARAIRTMLQGPQIGNRQALFRRLGQKEVAERRAGCLCKGVQLLERRPVFAFKPLGQAAEPGLQSVRF